MKDAESFRGQFAGRDEAWLNGIVNKLAYIIHKTTICPIVADVSQKTYLQKVVDPIRSFPPIERQFDNIFKVLVGTAVSATAETCRWLNINTSHVNIFFAKQSPYGEAKKFGDKIAKSLGFQNEIIFREPRDWPPLQAADMVAWLCHNILMDGPRKRLARFRERHRYLIASDGLRGELEGNALMDWIAPKHELLTNIVSTLIGETVVLNPPCESREE